LTVPNAWPLPVDGRRVWMTLHAIERYRDRVRPHLNSYDAIAADAARLAGVCGVLADRSPAWVNGTWEAEREMDTEPRGWLVCGDICMPLAEDREKPGKLVALTVLTRGGISDETRLTRNRRRAHRTYAKRKRNKMDSRLTRGQRPDTAPAFDD
jgi:hypothetical protein